VQGLSIFMPKSPDAPKEIAVLLCPAFSNHCLANAVEPLRAANAIADKKLYTWRHLGLTPGPVLSSSGLPVSPDATLSDSGTGQALLVMAGDRFEGFVTPAVARALRAASSRFDQLAGLDSGSWLLAEAGLLDGRKATIHWDVLDHFAETFPNVHVREDRVVHDPKHPSCGGGTTTLDFMLDFIEADHGISLRLDVAANFMIGSEGPHAGAYLPPRGTVDATVAVMRRNTERLLTIGQIAKQLGLSQRQFERIIQGETGLTPRALYRRVRLRLARRLVRSTRLPIAEIALRSGYENASAMTRAFKAEFTQTPRALRIAEQEPAD